MYARNSTLLILPLLVAACQDAGVCEEGSVERDGQCTPAAATVRLTHLDVRYDLSQPVHINNQLPITFGITADSVDPANPVTRNVAVTFSFVAADPVDPERALACSSSAINVEVTADGSEQLVQAIIWPTSLCSALAATGAPVNLQVDFDGGAEIAAELGSDLDAPSVVFTAANRGEALNQLCRASLEDNSGEPGCVHAINLQPTPGDAGGSLIDVRYGLSAGSSVALLPADPALEPSLVVQSRLVVNGRDPYVSAVDPALIPAGLVEAVPTIAEDLKFGLNAAALAAVSALPGRAVVSYTLRSADSTDELPLTIGDPAEPANRLVEAVVERILPGTANEVVHELYLDGEALAAVSPGGVWADRSDFVVRGCFAAEFPQAGNKGDGGLDDCRELEVVLVREAPTPSGAASLSFDKEFERKLGSDRISITSNMSTQNRLDLTGASSRSEGEVVLKGKLGASFELSLARAFGNATLSVDPTKTAYEAGVDAFNTRLYSASRQAATIVQSDDFSAAKSFTIGKLGFGFGPVTIGFKIGVGGEIGLEAENSLDVLADPETCQELLKASEAVTACGRMSRVTTPYFGLTGNIEGGIDLKIVKAAVVADLRFVTTSFPLEATLGWGLTEDKRLLVRGDATWDMSFQPLAGDVSIVGRVGFKRFSKSLKVNLFSFSSPTFNTRLLTVAMDGAEVLQ